MKIETKFNQGEEAYFVMSKTKEIENVICPNCKGKSNINYNGGKYQCVSGVCHGGKTDIKKLVWVILFGKITEIYFDIKEGLKYEIWDYQDNLGGGILEEKEIFKSYDDAKKYLNENGFEEEKI